MHNLIFFARMLASTLMPGGKYEVLRTDCGHWTIEIYDPCGAEATIGVVIAVIMGHAQVSLCTWLHGHMRWDEYKALLESVDLVAVRAQLAPFGAFTSFNGKPVGKPSQQFVS